MNTTIHPFPELRAYAEEEARAFAAAWESACEADWLAWDRLDQMTRERRVKTHLTLLCDLTRPASRDAVYRLVAGTLSHGWTPCRVQHAIAGHGLDWRALCARGLVPERYVCGPDEPSGAPASLAFIVRHLWPETP